MQRQACLEILTPNTALEHVLGWRLKAISLADFVIEDGLRGRTTARPPLVNGLGLNRRLLEPALGSGLEALI